MTTSEHVGDRAAAPLEADLARGKEMHAQLRARVAELGKNPGNAEARELRELEPKLVEHNAELRNSIAVIKLVGQQLELQEYVRIDGDAPLITRVLGFVAMADERTRRETMAAFTARGESPYTIEDAVMRLYRRGLVKRTRRGVVEAVHEKAWTAIEEEMARGLSSLTHRVFAMIEAEGPCGRREILARFSGEGVAAGAVDSTLQRLRAQKKVSTVHSGRTVSYTAADPAIEPKGPTEKTTAEESAEAVAP